MKYNLEGIEPDVLDERLQDMERMHDCTLKTASDMESILRAQGALNILERIKDLPDLIRAEEESEKHEG